MNAADVVRRRLVNQHLATPRFSRPGQLVAWLGAVQAQDYPGAKWALGQRLRDGTDAAIERAFAEGKILRTHVMRPTWHFVSPDDIRWLLDLTAPRVKAATRYYDRQAGMEERLFQRTNRIIERGLRDGVQLTRQEIASLIRRAGLASGLRAPNAIGHIMAHAELDGIVCSGAIRGSQFTYALLDERAPRARTLPREEALGELTKRYFRSHGPATIQDVTWWSGLTIADAKAGLDVAKSSIAKTISGHRTYWMSRSTPAPTDVPPSARLLPNFDEYIVGYADRSTQRGSSSASEPGAMNVIFKHTLVIGGIIAGTWKRVTQKDAVTIDIEPLATLGRAERRVVAMAVEQYARFLGKPVEVRGL
jgi:hypothetical protein